MSTFPVDRRNVSNDYIFNTQYLVKEKKFLASLRPHPV